MSVDESGRRSYEPGDWFGIFGERAAVLLPPTEKRRVGALWELLDDGADFDEALDALIATGLRDLPGFVLVSDADDTTRIVVRGAARAVFETADGPVEIDPAGAGTWVERTLVGVTSTILEVTSPDDEAAGTADAPAPMTLVAGLVRVSRVQTPAGAAAGALGAAAVVATPAAVAAPDDVEQVPEPEPEPPADHDALSDPAYAEQPAPAPAPEPEPEPEPAARLDEPTEALSFADLQDEPEPGPEPEPEPVPESGPPAAPAFGSGPPPERPQWAPAASPDNPFGPGPGGPGPGGQGPGGQGGFGGPPPPPAPAWGDAVPPPQQVQDQAPPEAHGPSDDPAADHDGNTNAGDYDPSVFARQQPGIPGQPPAPSVTARPVARLLMSHGETLDVDRAILIGRAPEARRFTADEEPRLVTVPSPHQEISSTHLEVRPGSGADHGSAVVTDMGSTNGTVLVQPGLPPEDLQPGLTVQLIPGAVIDLGDGLTIQVANP